MSKREMKQITSAEGWSAIYADSDAANSYSSEPLVCWALVDDDGYCDVFGIVATDYGTCLAEDIHPWVGYLKDGQDDTIVSLERG